MFQDATLIDLSVGIEDGAASEPDPASIDRMDHREGAEWLAQNLQAMGKDVEADDFPDGTALAWEEITAITHTATHMDAPYHYGAESEGEPARTIDEVPLEWGLGEAVVLDMRHLDAGAEIGVDDLQEALDDLNHDLSEGEIVLIQTGADELWGEAAYLTDFPGMGSEATTWLVEQGIKVIGTDAYGFDKPFLEMGARFEETGDSEELWPAHLAGREKEYCQIEKMANLDALPRKTNIPLVAFPIVVEDGSAGWVRPVAVIEDDAADDAEGGAT
ncbi:cyclase family protein [Natronomonas halophila]|uniref:cyclase family protein n=1 Tax=Natronomonas halophila TaxID=2747817 RepID=UPI0015B39591|nr:cyclase family protein [Natronomonas halophila]QLD86322.1 cyclase family protein [Natronomonas halophila]